MHNTAPLIDGKASDTAVILLHGRGGSAQDMLRFAHAHLPPARFIALQADDNQWYPHRFMVARELNEPYLSAALLAIRRAITQAGAPFEHIFIAGFSQGACLASEYAARNPERYGGILCFSGGLIGDTILKPESSLKGTPLLFGCSMQDPYIPISRVKESIAAFEESDAVVTSLLYPGDSHLITPQELEIASRILTRT